MSRGFRERIAVSLLGAAGLLPTHAIASVPPSGGAAAASSARLP